MSTGALSLGEHLLLSLLGDDQSCDGAFLCADGRSVAVHTALLSGASAMLRALFYSSGMKESRNKAVEVPFTSSAMGAVKQFIYRGGPARSGATQAYPFIPPDNALEVRSAASYFQIPGLEAACVGTLSPVLINGPSALRLLLEMLRAQASRPDAVVLSLNRDLLEQAVMTICMDGTASLRSPLFTTLPRELASMLLACDDLVVDSETDVMEAAIAWGAANVETVLLAELPSPSSAPLLLKSQSFLMPSPSKADAAGSSLFSSTPLSAAAQNVSPPSSSRALLTRHKSADGGTSSPFGSGRRLVTVAKAGSGALPASVDVEGETTRKVTLPLLTNTVRWGFVSADVVTALSAGGLLSPSQAESIVQCVTARQHQHRELNPPPQPKTPSRPPSEGTEGGYRPRLQTQSPPPNQESDPSTPRHAQAQQPQQQRRPSWGARLFRLSGSAATLTRGSPQPGEDRDTSSPRSPVPSSSAPASSSLSSSSAVAAPITSSSTSSSSSSSTGDVVQSLLSTYGPPPITAVPSPVDMASGGGVGRTATRRRESLGIAAAAAEARSMEARITAARNSTATTISTGTAVTGAATSASAAGRSDGRSEGGSPASSGGHRSQRGSGIFSTFSFSRRSSAATPGTLAAAASSAAVNSSTVSGSDDTHANSPSPASPASPRLSITGALRRRASGSALLFTSSNNNINNNNQTSIRVSNNASPVSAVSGVDISAVGADHNDDDEDGGAESQDRHRAKKRPSVASLAAMLAVGDQAGARAVLHTNSSSLDVSRRGTMDAGGVDIDDICGALDDDNDSDGGRSSDDSNDADGGVAHRKVSMVSTLGELPVLRQNNSLHPRLQRRSSTSSNSSAGNRRVSFTDQHNASSSAAVAAPAAGAGAGGSGAANALGASLRPYRSFRLSLGGSSTTSTGGLGELSALAGEGSPYSSAVSAPALASGSPPVLVLPAATSASGPPIRPTVMPPPPPPRVSVVRAGSGGAPRPPLRRNGSGDLSVPLDGDAADQKRRETSSEEEEEEDEREEEERRRRRELRRERRAESGSAYRNNAFDLFIVGGGLGLGGEELYGGIVSPASSSGRTTPSTGSGRPSPQAAASAASAAPMGATLLSPVPAAAAPPPPSTQHALTAANTAANMSHPFGSGRNLLALPPAPTPASPPLSVTGSQQEVSQPDGNGDSSATVEQIIDWSLDGQEDRPLLDLETDNDECEGEEERAEVAESPVPSGGVISTIKLLRPRLSRSGGGSVGKAMGAKPKKTPVTDDEKESAALLSAVQQPASWRRRAALKHLSTFLSWHYNFQTPWPGEAELRRFAAEGKREPVASSSSSLLDSTTPGFATRDAAGGLSAAVQSNRAALLPSLFGLPPPEDEDDSDSAVFGPPAMNDGLPAPSPNLSSSVANRLYSMPDTPSRRLRCGGPPDSFRGASLGHWSALRPNAAPDALPGCRISFVTWSWLVEFTAPASHPSFFLGLCEQGSSSLKSVTRTGLYNDGRLCRKVSVQSDESARGSFSGTGAAAGVTAAFSLSRWDAGLAPSSVSSSSGSGGDAGAGVVREMPALADGDLITFFYRPNSSPGPASASASSGDNNAGDGASEGVLKAYVNGNHVASFLLSPTSWVYPMAAIFSGLVRLKLTRYTAAVNLAANHEQQLHQQQQDSASAAATAAAAAFNEESPSDSNEDHDSDDDDDDDDDDEEDVVEGEELDEVALAFLQDAAAVLGVDPRHRQQRR